MHREKINKGLDHLRKVTVGGDTNVHYGLEKVSCYDHLNIATDNHHRSGPELRDSSDLLIFIAKYQTELNLY